MKIKPKDINTISYRFSEVQRLIDEADYKVEQGANEESIGDALHNVCEAIAVLKDSRDHLSDLINNPLKYWNN